MTLKNFLKISLAGFLLLIVWACAHSPPPQDLADARKYFEAAQTIQAGQLAPDQYLDAKESLKEAEKAWANELMTYDDVLNHKILMAKLKTETLLLTAQDINNRKKFEALKAEREDFFNKHKMAKDTLTNRQETLLSKEKELAEMQRKLSEAQERLAQLEKERENLRKELLLVVAQLGEIRETDRGLIVSLSNIIFSFNQWNLKPGAQKNLAKLAILLNEYPDRSILLEGHTDSVGDEEYNESLSQKRAVAVRDFLVRQGVSPSKLYVRGYGERYPLVTNDTKEGRQQNRRVDMVILDPEKEAKDYFLDSTRPMSSNEEDSAIKPAHWRINFGVDKVIYKKFLTPVRSESP
jgi:outer membrane protein OmpA-like peptidoglycan-associated protein